MFSITVQNNKKRYLDYNNFRQKIFLANSPKDGPVILYMLPWLLSVNRSSVPGFIKDLKEPFHVFNIENNKEILKHESLYKKTFGLKEERSLRSEKCLTPIKNTINSMIKTNKQIHHLRLIRKIPK